MEWMSGGLVYPNVSSWVLTPIEIPSESNLIKLTWMSEGLIIKSRLLLRRAFINGEVSEAKVIYPSDKPIVFAFNDFNGFNYQIEVKKIVNKWTLREHFAVMVHYQ
ncbi:hypothetical protein NO976_02561 [Planktothrix agardhii]|jgi:hypothetical protein|uniref:hypothetical protein n=1 Tax=Planktothrix agardhii TaxID=1160 RepID=UPI001A1BDB59|nr:hypothetical protein [Planktothrix agardhii]MBG0746638.1 hypothetical protein [Planktothrix agardhii KL2]MCF3575194.1 hypothetical protein [Planktothrix agardhii 1812]MCF3581017.1 hypothetical protein [Planktothrix agardhii 1811]CAD5950095.1 hypothetical protein NO976_02561 [Planktothrix agardhii]